MKARDSRNPNAGLFARGWWWSGPWLKISKGKMIDIAGNTRKVVKYDPRRIINSLKVGFAVTLVSTFYYYQPLYMNFGNSAMWAVINVIVVFEFFVGATLGKGLNRTMATFLGGALGIGAHYLANFSGHIGEPIIPGLAHNTRLLYLLTRFLAAELTFWIWKSADNGKTILLTDTDNSFCFATFNAHTCSPEVKSKIQEACTSVSVECGKAKGIVSISQKNGFTIICRFPYPKSQLCC